MVSVDFFEIIPMRSFSAFIVLSSVSVVLHAAEIGSPADAASAARTVEIALHDNYFEPESISVAAGETVRFVIDNQGNLLHQFTIATPAMHTAQQAEMAMMVDHGMLSDTAVDQHAMHMDHGGMEMGEMTHDAPNTVLVEPGQSAELTWTFPESGTLEYACNLPGRYDVGMVGEIAIQP